MTAGPGACSSRASNALAAPGTLGNLPRNSIIGPAYWNIDLGISRLIPMGTRRVELRVESFNVLNHFNWGDPVVNFNSGQFGRITTQAEAPPNGDKGPRILQFGIKYDF